MKLENQVCSLDLAKRLEELGVKQESLFYWVKMKGYWPLLVLCKEDDTFVRISGFDEITDIEEQYSAFTVAELGELLKPAYITFAWSEVGQMWLCQLHKRDNNQQWEVGIKHVESADTEADARGLMMCYLLENSLLKL